MTIPPTAPTHQATRPVNSQGPIHLGVDSTVSITPKYDFKTRQYVILWSDVLMVYRNAQYVLHDGRPLPFLVDDNFEELKPPRIIAHPDAVLDVVLGETLPDPSAAAARTTIESGGRGTESVNRPQENNASPTVSENETRGFSELNVLRQHMQRGPETYVDTSDVPRIRGYMKMVHSLEWHEAPMPRLFIVLPRTFVDDLTPNCDTFRLFWMCEYMGDSSKNSAARRISGSSDGDDGDNKDDNEYDEDDEITPHLDLHPGFDLDRPAEFFAKYGAHLLLNFKVFKYSNFNGFYQDNVSRLPLNDGPDIDYEQAIQFLMKSLEMTKEQVKQSIEMMIEHLHVITTDVTTAALNRKSMGSLYSMTWETENLPQLTADDLSQLQSFLFKPGMQKSGTQDMNNLFRSTNEDGHVQWVCHAHLHKIYPCALFGQTFMMNTEAHCGSYNAQLGQIISRPSTGFKARRLYGILHSSPGFVSDLHLHIGWNITIEDLSLLSSTIVSCNIVSLNLTGPTNYMDSPTHSELIIQILAKSRIQSFSFENAQGVLKNVNPLWLSSRFFSLRTLRLKLSTNGIEHLHGTRIRLLWVILNAPNLKYLSIEWDDMEKVFNKEELLWEIAKRPYQGLSVNLKVKGQDVSLTIDRGLIRNVHLKISNLTNAHDNPHIYNGYIQTLTVMECTDILHPSTEEAIRWILSVSPSLISLNLTCRATDFRPAEQLIKNTVLSLASPVLFEELVLKETAEDSVTATFLVDPPEASQPQQSTIRDIEPICVDVTVRDHDPGLESVLMNYGAYVRTFNTTHAFGLRQLMFLNNSIERQRKAQLKSLLIAVDCGRWRGNDCLKNIFERCATTLKQLTLVGYMDNPDEKEHILWTLASYKGRQVVILKSQVGDRHTRRVHDDSVRSQDGNSALLEWIQQVRDVIPIDTSLIVAEDFEALCEIVPGVTKRNTAWLQRKGIITVT
ncbi:hypothetical protein BGX27_011208 [Mortierella sp. AM989]|nr:hypothetical protein BGX27_011208 [Mortierella sp. AM989]